MSTLVNVVQVMEEDAIAGYCHRKEAQWKGVAENWDKSEQARAAVKDLFEKGRQLSAHLEHAIAIANVGSPDTVHVRHPIRVALDQFDEALRAAGGAA